MWTDNYIGLPFIPDGRDRTGIDCWGLVCLVYKEQLGIELPLYKGIFINQSLDSLKKAARTYQIGKEAWQLVSTPNPYDVIMLRTGKYIWHVGVVVDKRSMLHILSGINSMVEDYTGMLWKDRVEEYRHYVR